MTTKPIRLGIDVGGTNTDAVLMSGTQLLASHKSFTSEDVRSGVITCVRELLAQSSITASQIKAIMIGTTQFVNAFVQRKHLERVCVIRAAAPKTDGIPPLAGWPADLRDWLAEGHIVSGGSFYDGNEYAELDVEDIARIAKQQSMDGIRSFAISASFAPVRPDMEKRAGDAVKSVVPDAKITLSSEVGDIGLLDRENAAIINASLANLSQGVVASLQDAFAAMSIDAPVLFSQNDGTLISADVARRFPVLTCSAGPTNSLRGAAFLTGLEDAVIVDIGGTTTDIGFLIKGFPRETTTPNMIGGVRTNLRMPDLLSLPLGGGTIVRGDETAIKLGPDSVGHRLNQDGLVFGGDVLTTTDIAVASGHARLGDPSRLGSVNPEHVAAANDGIHSKIEDSIDQMRVSGTHMPVVLVGGGHILVSRELRGASQVVRPEHADVANAIGAAITKVSGRVNRIFDFQKNGREKSLKQARQEAFDAALANGAVPESVELVDLIELPMQYIDTGSAQVKARAVGDLELTHLEGGQHG
ncbi:MAG: hydantoinase/oxoprolinase family protein [Pseudomonadota bacterium]